MLYRFCSAADADLLMFKKDAEKILSIWNKPLETSGILLPTEFSHAIQSLQKAARLETQEAGKKEKDETSNERLAYIAFSSRIEPLIRMIGHCQQQDTPLIWKVFT